MVGIKFKVTARKRFAEGDRKIIEIPKAVREFIEVGKEYSCTLEEVKK